MKRALSAMLVLAALVGCGPMKNLDPLGGLGGADTSRYGFESSTQGWTCATETGSSCFSVSAVQGRSLFGQGCLAVDLFQMGNHYLGGSCGASPTDNFGRIGIDLTASPVSLVGKTVSAWVYWPSAGQASTSAPSQAQIYLIDVGNFFGNGVPVNLKSDNWTQIKFSPIAWPSSNPLPNTQGGIYVQPGFDPAMIKRVGIKIGASGAAPCTFAFTGTLLVDSVDW